MRSNTDLDVMGDSGLNDPLCPHIEQYRLVFREAQTLRDLEQLLKMDPRIYALGKDSPTSPLPGSSRARFPLLVWDRFEASIEDEWDCCGARDLGRAMDRTGDLSPQMLPVVSA